jgi:hypothetical protein
MAEEQLHVELCDCENILLREIATPELKRPDIAQTYLMAMLSSESNDINWRKVNEAIIARWSRSALEWIKKEAWRKRLSGRSC